MMKNIHKKMISLFMNYLLLSLIFAFPYLISVDLSVVYAQSESGGENIDITFATSPYSWSVLKDTSYFHTDTPIYLYLLFSGIGNSNNVRNVNISYTIGSKQYLIPCTLYQSSDVAVKYSCTLPAIYSTTDTIKTDEQGKYIPISVKVYYEFYDGSSWNNKEYDKDLKVRLEDSPQEEQISADVENIGQIDFISDYYTSNGRTYCKISSLHTTSTLINISTNYPNGEDTNIYPTNMLKNISISLSGGNINVGISSSCTLKKSYNLEDKYILEYKCSLQHISSQQKDYVLCDNIAHSNGDFITYDGSADVSINGGSISKEISGKIYFGNAADINDILENNINVSIAKNTPFSWSIIPSKGYFYMDENIPVKVTFNLPDINIKNVKISYDFDNYNSLYSCTLDTSSSDKKVYSCTLPRLYGSASFDIVRNHKLNTNVKVVYVVEINGEEVSKVKYASLDIPLEEQYSESDIIYSIDNIKLSDSLDFTSSTYIANSGESYCRLEGLADSPLIDINLSTNYLDPNAINLNLNEILFSYPNGESNIPVKISGICNFQASYPMDKILEYKCKINDVQNTPYKLCYSSQLMKGSILKYDGILNVEIQDENTRDSLSSSLSGNVFVDSVASSLDISSEIKNLQPGNIPCKYYDSKDVCAYLNKALEPVSFDLILHNVDPTLEIESLSLTLGIDDSYYGSGDDYNFGGCSLSDRNSLDVIYECNYYLPLMNRDSTSKILSYDGILAYKDKDGKENDAFISGSYNMFLDISKDDNAKIFVFLKNTSFEESQPKVWFSEGVDGGLNCYVDPYKKKCYFGNVKINNSEINYPLTLFISGVAFTNIQDDDEPLFNLSFSLSSIPGKEYSVPIYDKDCVFEDFANFKGLYKVYCTKDLSSEEPFTSGIPYDPKNPPTLHYNLYYETGLKAGQLISTGYEDTRVDKALLEKIGSIEFKILDIVFTKQILNKVFKLSPGLVLEGYNENYPVCRIPVYIGKYFAQETGCDDNDWSCIISKADALSRAQLENAYCKFDTGVWFVGRISGIYNKSSLRLLKARYFLGDESNVAEMSISPSTCIDRSSGKDRVCKDYHGDGSTSGCIVVDEGDKDSLLLLCPFEHDLGRILDLNTLPSVTMLREDPLVVSISVEDNGFLRNGTGVFDFKYIIENSYGTINTALNSLKQEQKHIHDRIKDLKNIEHRLLVILGVLTGLDAIGGYKYRPISKLSFLPGPSTCLLGCSGCLVDITTSTYWSCVGQAFHGTPPAINPFVPQHPNGCGFCLPILDAAFTCALSGSMLIGKSLVSQVKNYREQERKLDEKIISLQQLLTSKENEVRDPLSQLNSYTSYISNSLNTEGGDDKNTFARSWNEKLFMEGIPNWVKIIIGVGYGVICVKALTGAGEKVAGTLGERVLYGGLLSMGVSGVMQWIYTGKVNPAKMLISGVVGAGIGALSGPLGEAASKSKGILGFLSQHASLAFIGGTAVISLINGNSNGFFSTIGNFFLAGGIGLGLIGAIKFGKEFPDVVRDAWNKHKLTTTIKEVAKEGKEETVDIGDKRYTITKSGDSVIVEGGKNEWIIDIDKKGNIDMDSNDFDSIINEILSSHTPSYSHNQKVSVLSTPLFPSKKRKK